MIECKHCQDSGKSPGSDYLDCRHCDSASERHKLNEFVSKLKAERVPEEDAVWLIHRRALARGAA